MKGYRDNGGGARNTTVYDDVFGGPPKFGASTLPPRVEDYTEIFQGFHASRGSSIPVLDLPAPAEDSDDVWFDVRSSTFDYSEVFGGSNGLDFAVSYDELFKNSKAGNVDDLSDEAWTPAQSESLSDEADPYPSLEMENNIALTATSSCLFDVRPQNEPNLEAEKDVLNRMPNESQFLQVPGSAALESQALPNKIENENFFSLAFNDVCASSKDLGGVSEQKKLKKSFSQPLDSVCGTERYGNQKDYPVGNMPLLSVSDLGLKTQPSHLPPPSRPPPALTSKKGDFSNFDSKLKMSKSYAFERMTGDHSPPYFDVEIDSSSSAAAAMKDAVEQAQAKLKSAKVLMDRKKEGLQTRSKLRMENNVGDKKGRVNEGYEVSNVFGGERMKGSLERDNTLKRHEVREENQKMKKMNDVKGAVERENSITEAGNSIEIKPTKESKLYLGVDKTKGTVASREAAEPFETVVRKPVQDAEILEPNAKFAGFKKYNKPVFESFEPMEDRMIVQERDFSGLEENNERQETLNRSGREEDHLNEPTAPHKTSKPEETDKMFLVSQKHGDIKILNDSENELFNLIEIQLKDNDMKPREEIVTENWLKNDNGKKEVDMGPASYIWEDYDAGFEEASEKEQDKELKETEEQEENEFQQSYLPEISIMQSEEEDDYEREGDRKVKDFFQWEEDVQGSVKASEQEECGNISETVSEQNEKILAEELTHEEDKIKVENAFEKEVKVCARDDAHTLKHAEADEKIKTIHEMDYNAEENKNLQQEWERKESEKNEETASENDDIENETEGTKWDENESITEENPEMASDLLFQVDDNEILQATGDLEHSDKNDATTLETPFYVKSHRGNEEAEETVEQIYKAVEESFSSFELNKNDLQGVKVEVRTEDVTFTNSSNESRKKTPIENDKRRTTTSTTTSTQLAKESVESGTKPLTDQVESLRNTNRSMERKDEICNKVVSENRVKEERLQRVRELENERLRKIEEERERQIEREKDRMAVDRATLEARETRERSERAAVEKATAEFRQRALADARERLEKACAEARERSLAEKALEGRLRVEKATAEARERAVADKFSSYQNTGIRQNSLPSDLAGTYSGLRYSQTAAQSVGGEGESPQRCKARLERHQRTADRAANALAEKNTRDLIAQQEQAERNRLAEVLDADVKRWSTGKQGNLRALLSTLQYILGSDSGWQAVPLTEVVTAPAVKKAYRKATLCVHPDKLQQRGATIQQKYICEKVFDLLKEAWTKFNSEER